MKELRAFLVETFRTTPGCAGHGHGSPLGRMLEKPGVKAKILVLFDKAEKAAAKDPDKRALAHVKKDRMFFESTWVKAYEEYVSNFREITIYRRKGKITIDGEIMEKDWADADIITRFWSDKTKSVLPDEQQTYVRFAYDNDNLYFAVEAMEPHPEKIVIRQGYFPETAVGMPEEQYALVSLDADLYQPMYEGLQYFYPRMSPGGYIILHDYNSKQYTQRLC